jgi:protein involved in temperature-dependent protein secretion
MRNFLQLTRTHGTQVWINFNLIVSMEANPQRQCTDLHTQPFDAESTTIIARVKETPEQIDHMLRIQP